MVRLIYVVHESEGRLRLRLPWLRRAPEQGEPLAEALARIEGIEEVQVRPFTGSILCVYEPGRCEFTQIREAIEETTGVQEVLRRGERSAAEEAELLRSAREHGPAVALAVAGFFKGLNLEVLRTTDGQLDLGTLSALGFLGAGAAQIFTTGKVPLPPWFTLSWWAIRTFSTYEQPAIERSEAGQPALPS
jgi:hypothetical protein